MKVPAIVLLDDRLDKLKFPLRCETCKEVLLKGTNVFFSKESGWKYWHSKVKPDGTQCFDSDWKKPGTPWDVRRKLAIAHRLNSLSLNDQIKLMLRRFRKELEIPLDKADWKPEVFQYLNKHKLVDFDDYKKVYVIVPKGFNWDVDEGRVRMPVFNEDVMQRDKEVDVEVLPDDC